ncbi:non-ribosomal peptide synthetase [Nocardiopsis valliformis]|uniref:non-ribosomal peptide synthetase n=1 Tax=Nocardiopsis valliformis TaxID=239974 RepID=UPI00034603E9|nr:non-ribosomal peptide synthetase [Nocardiopsis valliformis]
MEELVVELLNRGVGLCFDGDRLDTDAPDGSLPAHLREEIATHHDRLVSLLQGNPHPRDLPRLRPRTQDRLDAFPLTDIQQGYLIGRTRGLELGGVSSHFSFEFDGPALDVPRLSAALDRVVARHDMLRTVVDADGTQHALAEVTPCTIATTDLRDADDAERDDALERIRAELDDQVLPADQWPLFDVRATHLPGNRTRLHLSVDLLFVDARSLLLLLTEWRRFYDDPTWSPAPLDLSFRDYVLAENELRDGAPGARAAQYWLSRLDDLPPAPDLPLAAAPEQIGRPAFVRRRAVLPRERWAALSATARRHGLTPSALLLAAYCEVLRTWSRRHEFTVTLTRFHRLPLHPQVDQIVGNFLSPNLLAVRGRADESFRERAAGVQRRLLADLAHSSYGGVRVLRELTRHQGDGRTASMPVVFTSTLDGDTAGTKGDPLSAFGELVHGASQTPQVWLENQIFEEDGALTVNWNAVEELFPAGTLDAMFDAYRDLLDRLVDDTAAWDRTGGLVPVPETQLAERREANATAQDIPPRRLHDLVAEAAERRPDAVAVIADGVETTYRELTADAHRIARRLRAHDCADPNTLVAVSMRPGAAQISALLGVLHAGAAYVAIDPELPEERRHTLLRRCRSRAVITDADLRDTLAWPDGVEVITPEDPATGRCGAGPLNSPQGYGDLAYVIFTSGSTGEPKGVMITHESAGNTVQDINRRFEVTERDRVLALAPAGFDLSVYDFFGVLGAGGTVVVPSAGRGNDVAHWTELIDRHGVTLWNSVPAPMRLWTESLADASGPGEGPGPQEGSSGPGRTLRLALLSGDWIPVSLPDQIRRRVPGMRVISLGGATEGSIWSVCHPIGEVPAEWSSIPYGKPLANQTLHVLNGWLEPSPAGVTGDIYIGGLGVAEGYWSDPERTDERFIVHPATGERLYRTGDLGRYLPGGDIEILGREDFQVKINGYRVELGEIEAALGRLPGMRQTMVTAPAHPRTGQRQITAYVVGDDPATLEPVALRTAMEAVLPGYMVPSHYLTLDALPLTPNGKLDRASLPAPWSDDDGGAQGRTAPSGGTEERLFALWAEMLGHGDFGTGDGFFDVGGDSMHAVRIIARLRADFGIDADAEQEVIEGLFMNATVTDFAGIIASFEKQRESEEQREPEGQVA